jgi:hypothetical protein
MDKKHFTEEEMKELLDNPYVVSVTSTLITYTEEFKRIFIAQDKDGKLPREIFRHNGFDVDLLGGSRMRKAAYRWRKAYKEQGLEGLMDTRKFRDVNRQKRELSIEEKNARLEVQIQLLKAENELLKKLDMMERGLKTDK